MITARVFTKTGGSFDPVVVSDEVYGRASIIFGSNGSGKDLIHEIISQEILPDPKSVIFNGTLQCGSKIVPLKLMADPASR